MGEEERRDQASPRYARWVAMWAAGVRACGPAVLVGDPVTGDITQLSPAAARLVGDAANYLEFVEPKDASAQLLRLMNEGLIEGARTRRRMRHPDGSVVDVHAIGWVVRSPDGPDLGLGLWMPDLGGPADGDETQDVLSAAFPKQDHVRPHGDRLLLDEAWHVREIQSHGDLVLGSTRQELLNTSLLERTHRDDVPTLLFALARATTGADANALVRMRDRDGLWRAVAIAPTILHDDDCVFVALVLEAELEPGVGPSRPSITAIPDELRRIADHIETAAVMAPLADINDTLGFAVTGDLSQRQWEIVRRLVRGERVSTIASEMFLSRSTIRNHLSAIFAKAGVHSQEELVALYHRQRATPPPD